MKTDFDKELEELMMTEQEIPAHVRKRLDSTYDMIQTQSKREKSKFIWKRVTAAACALLITGGALANEQVRASITDFFSFQDKGIERALVEGFSEENNSTATDQQVKVTLQQNFSDANKIGMSFQLDFADLTILEHDVDVREVTMDYRLKNGDGEYIAEFIPDTKPLKGENAYATGITYNNPILDVENGVVQFDVVLDANKGNLPNIKDAVIEIEAINIFYEYDYLALQEEFGGPEFDLPMLEIEGDWVLSLVNQDENKPVPTHQYVVKEANPNIEFISATASPTSLNVKFIVDTDITKNEVRTMKIIDEAGAEYESTGRHLDTKSDKTTIELNFPISSYNDAATLKLHIEDLGEVNLIKK